jgi:hypothetical protein
MKKGKKTLHIVRKVVVAALLCVAAWSGAQAAPISREQALRQAHQLLQQRGDTRQLVAVDADVSMAATRRAQQQSGMAAPYYVFNRGMGEGFVIVSGDDATSHDILGYCDSGTFNYDQLPPNMQEWLDGYAQQIEQLSGQNTSSRRAGQPGPMRIPTHPKVEQLMASQWSQGSPYNDECPEYFNLGRSVTGCVATAYAQILYYHREKMPTETQAAIPAYTTWTSHPTYGQLHVEGIPAGSPLDWANMRDTYGGSRTAAEKKAVAQLMHYCGVAVHMDYTNSSSGAQSREVADALRNYFGFGSSVRYVGDAANEEAWDALIYAEIAEGRPVYISGANSEAGHAFVCDGYDGNHLYHINWGWGGMSDGYYYLSNLTPGQQGIGGSGDGYNGWREIVIGIEPENYQEKTMTITDATARQLLTAAFDQDGNGHLSYGEAAAVTSLGTVLQGSAVASLAELRYFTALTAIDDDAFSGCLRLTTLQLPKQVQHIGARAFKGCQQLQAVTLPQGIASMGDEAFSGCRALAAISLPSSLHALPARTFSGCRSLTELTLHAGLTSLGDECFADCQHLAHVTVSTMVPQNLLMGSNVFADCMLGQATLHVMQGTRSFFEADAQWQQFGTVKEQRELSRGEFATLTEGQQVYLYHVGSGRYLSKGEAWGTQAIASTGTPMRFMLRRNSTMPEGAYYLYSNDTGKDGHYLFRTWTDNNVGNGVLATFVDGGSLTQNAHWAVQDVGDNTYTLSIPEGYAKYDAACRWGVQNNHPSQVAQPTWGIYADVPYAGHELDCQWRLVKYDADLAANFEAAQTLENLLGVAIARGKKTTKEQAVLDNLESTTAELLAAQGSLRSKLRLVDFSDAIVGQTCRSSFDLDADGELSVEEASKINDLGTRFYGTAITSFDELQLFTSLKDLYGNSFENCRQLGSIVLPSSIERIYYRVFMNCPRLTSINLPENLSMLGDNAFDGCSSLRTVTVLVTDPAAIALGQNVFRGVPLQQCTLQVPFGSKERYAEAPVWRNFGNIVEVRGKAQPRFSPLTANTPGYIYNVGSRKLLAKGEAWGTQAIVGQQGMVYEWRRSATMPDGQYYLYSDQTGKDNKVLYRTSQDSKVGTGVKACYVDGTLEARSYWHVEQTDDEGGPFYTLQVPEKDATYTEGQYLGTNIYHSSEFASPTDGAYWDIDIANYRQQCLWAFITLADMQEAQTLDAVALQLRQLIGRAQEKQVDTTDEQAVYDNRESTIDDFNNAITALRQKLHYIDIDDVHARTICLEHWDDDEDGELSLEEAAAVEQLGDAFSAQSALESLDVLKYFTSLTTIPENAFRGSMSLHTVFVPASVTSMGKYAFSGCSSLKYLVLLNASAMVPLGESSVGPKVTVFVPQSVLASYEGDATWSTRTLTEYTGTPTVRALPVERIYGRTVAAMKWDVTGAPINGEPTLACEELSVGTTPVGDYPIHVGPGTITTPALVCQEGVLTVTPAPLTITAKSYTRSKGEPNPAFEVTYKGWRNRETADVLLRQPVVTCEATPDSPAGEYAITVSGAEAQNYDITYVDGVLTVEDANAIADINGDATNRHDVVYDVQGRAVKGTPRRGIYVTRRNRKVVF